jgi:phage recombination protein Bet
MAEKEGALTVKDERAKDKELVEIVKDPAVKGLVTMAQVRTLKGLYPKMDAAHMMVYLYECQRKGVSPMDRALVPLLFFDKNSGAYKMSIHSTIDYFRGKASATKEYDGQDEPSFLLGDGKRKPYSELLPGDIQAIVSASVPVFRKGVTRPFVGTAMMSVYRKTGFGAERWDKDPAGMLAKCAEAQGFRKAFPHEFGEVYIPEELPERILEAETVPPQPKKDGLKVGAVTDGRPASSAPAPADGGPSAKVGGSQTPTQAPKAPATNAQAQPPASQEKVVDAEVVQEEATPELTVTQMIQRLMGEKGWPTTRVAGIWSKLGYFGSWENGTDSKKMKLLEELRKGV